MTQAHFRTAMLIALVSYLLFSATDTIIRLLTRDYGLPQAQVLLIVIGAGFIPILGKVALKKEWADLKPKRPLIVIGNTIIATLQLVLVYQTFQHLSMIESYAIFFTVPIWVAIFAAFILHEKLNALQIAALITGFAGALLANPPSMETGLSYGQLTGIAAAVCSGISFIFMRKGSQSENSATMILSLFIGLMLFNIATLESWQPLGLSAIGLAVGAGFLQSFARLCTLESLRLAPASLVAPFQYSQVIWGALFGYVVFKENISLQTLAGISVVCASGFVLMRARSRPIPPPQAHRDAGG